MRVAPRPTLFKYLFGQHILNGVAVAVGVGLVAMAVVQVLGFAAGMAAASGALCVSIGDTPSPFSAKARILPLSWFCAVFASAAAMATAEIPALEALVIVLGGGGAGLLLAWGRWAIPLSVLVMLSMVFTLGAPISGFDERLNYEAMFALGGALYIVVGLILTRLLDASSRRMTIAECLREFAGYFRRVADFYKKDADQGEVYLKVVEQQASLNDHLQTARALLGSTHNHAVAVRLMSSLGVILDALDGVVSANADHAPLLLAGGQNGLAARVMSLCHQLADDLDELALDLLIGQNNLTFPDHQPALDKLSEEIGKIEADPLADPRLLRAARMTRARFGWVCSRLALLPVVMARQDAAEEALTGVDIKSFVPPIEVSLAKLRANLRWSSPIFRHAIRLGLALGAGYALIVFVPGLRHGNWILLTTAVIMRASYSVTRQRRDDRVYGSLIGCVLAGALLWSGSQPLMIAAQLCAVAVAHAFVRVNYRISAIGATVMALMAMHLIDPVEAPPVLARMFDTLIGAGIAFVFNMLLPQWEHQGAPAIAKSLLANTARYADLCLRWDAPEQDYRMARKNLIEALASLSESAERMKNEPEKFRALWPEYGRLIAASYTTAAQIVTVRLLIRNRLSELDPKASSALLDRTREAVLAKLAPDAAAPLMESENGPPEPMSDLNAYAAMRRRCAEVRRAAAQLRDLVAKNWTPSAH